MLIDEESLQSLVAFARAHSPYFRDLYAHLPATGISLADLPVIDHPSFWDANSGSLSSNKVLTTPFVDGLIFRTGGTTAVPKASYCTRDEFRRSARVFAEFMIRGGLRAGDRVANLLYGGDLYKGFLELGLGLLEISVPNVHLSIGVAPLESQHMIIRDFEASVVVAMPTILCRLADFIIAKREISTSVRLVFYVGEFLHPEQKALVRRAFPMASIGPMFYGSVDAGLIGTPNTGPDQDNGSEILYTLQPGIVMELLTDTNEPIIEEGRLGNIVVTNLTRRLMPVIRYPTGDMAEWTDFNSRIFRLRGRGQVGVRIGMTNYDMANLREVLSTALKDDGLLGFQVLATRKNGKDGMTFRIACRSKDQVDAESKVRAEMDTVNTEWALEVEDGLINPLEIEWVSMQDLQFNARSGKLKDIIDLRLDVAKPALRAKL